jgi:hypothetical protein
MIVVLFVKNQESVRIKEISNSKLAELYGIAPSLHLNYIVESDELNDDDIGLMI